MSSTDTSRFGPATPGWTPKQPRQLPSAAMLETAEPRRRWVRWVAIGLVSLLVAAGLWFGGRETAPSPAPATSFSVLETRGALPAGATLTSSDLTVAHLTHRQPSLVTAAQVKAAVGQRLRTYLPAGALLRSSSLMPSSSAAPGPGQALVGLALKPGQLPQGGVVVGDTVEIVILPTAPSSGPPPLPVKVAQAPVWAVSSQSSSTAVTVLVPNTLAAYLSGAASYGLVTLVDLGFPAS